MLPRGKEELDFFVLGVLQKVQTLTEAGVKPYILKPLALARAANQEES